MKETIRVIAEEFDVCVKQLICDKVAEEYDIPASAIMGKSRKKPYPEARKMACYIMDSEGISRPDIHRFLDLDRSDVFRNIEKMEEWIRLYSDIRHRHDSIIKNLLKAIKNEIKAN